MLLVLLLVPVMPAFAAPVSDQGSIDLRQSPLETDGPVALRGDWLFYLDQFVEPASLPAATAGAAVPIHVPATWGSAAPDKRDTGYGTYRLRILLADVRRVLGLYLPTAPFMYCCRWRANRAARRKAAAMEDDLRRACACTGACGSMICGIQAQMGFRPHIYEVRFMSRLKALNHRSKWG